MPPTLLDTILVAVAAPEMRQQPVLQRAASLARACHAKLILFHSVFEPALSGRPLLDTVRLQKARGWLVEKRSEALERHVTALRRMGIEAESRVTWEEPPYEAVIRAAIRDGASLVVAGPHASDGYATSGLRHTDWELLRFCPCPLLLTRAVPTTLAAPVLAALDPTHANDKPTILDRQLVQFSRLVANALEAPLHFVHCIAPSAYAIGGNTPRQRQAMRQQRIDLLSPLLDDPDTARLHVVHGLPEAAIPGLARRLQAQIVVMGAISRRGLARFAVGNTAERIIERLPSDLLVIKPVTFKLRLGRRRREIVAAPSPS